MEKIILFAPLIGAILCGFGWRFLGEKAALWTTTGLVFLAMLFSWVVFLGFDGVTRQVEIFRWIESGSMVADWAIRVDRLTAIMLVVVTTVSAFVHLYSFGYMDHDPEWREGEVYKPRFFAYLSFFTFTMLALVTADNIVQLFFGWEGVGVASYLLIGFYYRKPSANAAAIKAFVVNRVGDFGFLLGIFALFFLVDSVNFDDIFAAAPTIAQTDLTFLNGTWNAANVVGVLLFIGAMGKSAQLLLHTWLPDAMEGPTPVSALIHAATMVTAGVFLMSRMSPILEFAPDAQTMIVVVGAATAFFAATVGLVQNDIKRVIAYSTCSQLGYMFVAVGVGVYSAAMFHLFTHAFFKALLFLGAGSVIHAMHHEQDMRRYGGLKDKIPYTFWAMLIGTLAITGVGIPLTHIGFAGFLSKDAIIESAWGGGATWAFWTLVFAAAMTSFYSWRLMFLTFWGTPRGDKHTHEHAHESSRTMLIPLGVLSLGAVVAGMVWFSGFFGSQDQVNRFYGIPSPEIAAVDGMPEHALPGQGALYMAPDNDVMAQAKAAPKWVKSAPFLAMLLGLGIAYMFYIGAPGLPERTARSFRPLYLFLLNKWYFDELFDAIFVRPAKSIGRALWKGGDGSVIDGAVNGVSMGIVPFFTRVAGRLQSGYLYHYAFAMVIGIALLITWMMLTGGAE
ncbi:NADH-quinone oxidoreductase subunit L [Rhodovulum strictum]|uniref:NADH-quinone oxidoreductase subunit L n=1 Tax=Rhodovulum strictum TaxID=58314 RepID=A0A844B0T9_9RHOB|nr:NADH-quinone oxidoreductase subunit L [Rhodovulum strictum]MRH19986.1 NADH-quinone oxidoreductase subunit L [Rhodovulum strictum]